MRRKLQGRYPANSISQVLDELAAQGLQSDQRFAEQYVSQRIAKGYGPLRIDQELRGKGIAATLIQRELEERKSDWPRLLREASRRKYGPGLPAERNELARRARFLEYRGFPADLISSHLFCDDG